MGGVFLRIFGDCKAVGSGEKKVLEDFK